VLRGFDRSRGERCSTHVQLSTSALATDDISALESAHAIESEIERSTMEI
jgi:hypothetical protein